MEPPVRIESGDPLDSVAISLLREAAEEARQLYPELFSPGTPWPTNEPLGKRDAFVLALIGGKAAGCGALREIDACSAEVRRMFVRRESRRFGVGRAILSELESKARGLGYRQLLLETGFRQAAAIALYESAGFRRIARFGRHVDDPTSVCFEKTLVVPE